MVGLEKAYDLHEVVSTTNALNRMVRAKYTANELKFNLLHNKMLNIWKKLHLLQTREECLNLED